MTGLLVLLVLVLISIAVWQLVKIFDLTQIGVGNDEDSQIATDNDNRVNGNLMFIFLGIIYIFMILGTFVWSKLVLGTPASAHGPEYDSLFMISYVLIFIVQVITQALLHYFAFKYRGRAGQKATYFADNNKLEVIWSSIPAIVLAGLIFYGLYAWNDIMFVDDKQDDAIIIELYAKQFAWEARYSGKDNVLGKANVRYIEGTNTLGVDLSDPNAQDDFSVTELHLPKGRRVIFKIRSQDVLHSAYMPHFRAQMNCVPGMVTQFSFIPTVTTAEMRDDEGIKEKVANINKIREAKSALLVKEGKVALDPYTFDYLLLCNKICGASHYNMQMKIVVDEPADFKKWIAEKSATTIAQAVKADAEQKAKEAAENLAPKKLIVKDTATTTVDTSIIVETPVAIK